MRVEHRHSTQTGGTKNRMLISIEIFAHKSPVT